MTPFGLWSKTKNWKNKWKQNEKNNWLHQTNLIYYAWLIVICAWAIFDDDGFGGSGNGGCDGDPQLSYLITHRTVSILWHFFRSSPNQKWNKKLDGFKLQFEIDILYNGMGSDVCAQDKIIISKHHSRFSIRIIVIII